MINTNEFRLSTLSGKSISIDLNDKVSVITGDSSTGKTMMLEFLEALKLEPTELKSSTIQLGDIEVCLTESSISILMAVNTEGKLIFIDRFEILQTPELIKFIWESKNYFVICCHTPSKDLYINEQSVLSLSYDKDTMAYKTKPIIYSGEMF